jgi:DNA-binding MurR/RpiR family transcriptional regulator
MVGNLGEIAFASAEEIAARVGISDATVVRCARALGYNGLPALKRAAGAQLASTLRPPLMLRARIEHATDEGSGRVDRIYAEAPDLIAEAHQALDHAVIDQCLDMLERAGQIYCYGIGPSGLVGEYLALRLNRSGHRAHAITRTGILLADDLISLRAGDAVVIFAPARSHPEIEALLNRCADLDIAVALITDTLEPVYAKRVTAVLRAPTSSTGLIGETFTAHLLADLLVTSMQTRDPERAVEASSLLTDVRESLRDPR